MGRVILNLGEMGLAMTPPLRDLGLVQARGATQLGQAGHDLVLSPSALAGLLEDDWELRGRVRPRRVIAALLHR
jgi:hypothetical protein